MALFKDMSFNFDAEAFQNAEFWMSLLREAIGTALWVVVNQLMSGSAGVWSLGLSYLIVQSAIGGSYNALVGFNSFLQGKSSFFNFLFDLIAQLIGAIGIMKLFVLAGIEGSNVKAVDSGIDIAKAFSLNGWQAAFFNGEFFGIFLYTCFVAKARDHAGIPDGIWNIFLVTVAVLCGAKVFFPANAFVGDWNKFIGAGAWVTVLFQLLASFFAQVVLEYLWN
jgi:hypothetical protein